LTVERDMNMVHLNSVIYLEASQQTENKTDIMLAMIANPVAVAFSSILNTEHSTYPHDSVN